MLTFFKKPLDGKPCRDCVDGLCTMNCGPAVEPEKGEEMPKQAKKAVTHPCPLCGSELSAEVTIMTHVGFNRYAKVNVKFTCWNDKCRYVERTRGECHNEETIQKMRDLCADFRGPEMFKRGRFEDGSVGVNRRRHTGINKFEPVSLPEKGNDRANGKHTV